MMKRRIWYLLLLLEGCSLVMLYDFQGLRFLLCCFVCIPLACFLLLVPMVFCCRVSLEAQQQAVTRSEPCLLKVVVENKGLFPAAGVVICVSWKAPGEKERKARKRLKGLGSRTREEILFELSAMHCGQAQFQVNKARLYDYLGIFSLPVRKNANNADICIYPVVTPIMKEGWLLDPWAMGKEREGDMLLRDYLPGDSLHRIYWKLAAKAGELQIRDFELSGSIRLWLDFSTEYRKQSQEWDVYLDMACSLLYFLLEEPGGSFVSVEVLWMQGDFLLKCDIPDEAALQAWMGALLAVDSQGMPPTEEFVQELAREETPYPGEALCLREDCRLYFGEQCVYG